MGFYNPLMQKPDFGSGVSDFRNKMEMVLMMLLGGGAGGLGGAGVGLAGSAANAPVATGNTQAAPQLMPMGGQPSAGMAPPPPRPGAMMGGAGGGGMAGAMGGGQPGGAGIGGMNPELLRMLIMALMGKGGGIPGMGR